MSTPPVLDDDALQRLGEQLGDSDALCGFLRRYLALLDQRIARLDRALKSADQSDWMDAVLSLKTSSAMAGALALADQAAELQHESASCPSWHAPAASAAFAGSVESLAGPAGGTSAGPASTRRAELMACLRRLAEETSRQLRIFLHQAGGNSRPGADLEEPPGTQRFGRSVR